MDRDLIKILIVEDDEAHVEAIKRAFKRSELPAGVKAVSTLKEFREFVSEDIPHVLLIDLNLPDGRATEVLTAPAEDGAFPVLIMTAFGSETMAVEAMKAGALDYIVKSPAAFADMPKTVGRLLREWRILQEHKWVAEALQESEHRFRTLLQEIPSIAVQGYAMDGTVHYWNLASEKLYGYSSQEALGRNLVDLIIPPEIREDVIRGIRWMDETGLPVPPSELTLMRRDGSRVSVFSSHSIVKKVGGNSEFFCIDIDITERKKTEIQLQKLNLAVEQSPAAVVITNLDGAIEYVNPKFTQVTGYTFAEVLGQNPRVLQSGNMAPKEYQQLWQTLLAGKEWHGEFHNKRKDGSLFWEYASISPLRDAQGKITHYVAVKEDVTIKKEYERQLEFQATHDELTGLANRALLKDLLEQSIHYAQRSGRMVAVLLLDLDRFKVVNDSLGHAVGDELLQKIAQRLKDSVREADTVARLGGDEFVILLTEVEDAEDVRQVAGKILRQLTIPIDLEGREIIVTASLGLSLYPVDGRDHATLIRNADIAMYQAKKEGSSFSFFRNEMNLRLLETLELESALRSALDPCQFRLFYQPKVDLQTGRICGCEALIRWFHPQRGIISPGDFIPLAEETGLIVPIGKWALHEACRQSKFWQDQGFAPLSVAVNLSARQFRKGDLLHLIDRILADTGLAPHLLELELTESMIMEDPLSAERTMQGLKELGVGLSLDDFGTGYSSLNYLRRFPVDSLKIDRSFINDVTIDPSGASVVTSVIAIAHNLGIAAIAEGVETLEQLEFLKKNLCDAYQGFYFSKPLPANEFAELLTHRNPLGGRIQETV